MAPSLLPPEVLQLGVTDCGPAVLAAALRGFGIDVHLDELRERLGSDEEGTSIGALERVAREYGLEADEVMVPIEQVVDGNVPGPAIVVTRLADGRTHFVLLWRRLGGYFFFLDPARGRGFVGAGLRDRLLVHEHEVPAEAWRSWAATAEFLDPLAGRLRGLGFSKVAAEAHLQNALADSGPKALAQLDAAVRAATELVEARALRRSEAPARVDRLLAALGRAEDPESWLEPRHFSALPRAEGALLLRGALLVRLKTPKAPKVARPASRDANTTAPLQAAWRAARVPLILTAALSGLLAAAEGLGLAALARGPEGGPALVAATAVATLLLLALGGCLDVVAQRRALAAGRSKEIATRIDLAERLPELPDAVIHSRSRADLADRIHSATALRHGPFALAGGTRSLAELAAIFTGLCVLAPTAAVAALLTTLIALGGAWVNRRRWAELETAWRVAAAELATFASWGAGSGASAAALGLGPALRAEHEASLQRWSRQARLRARSRLFLGALLGLGTTVAAGLLLATGDTLGLLLMGWWALRLPALGEDLVSAVSFGAVAQAMQQRLDELRGPEPAPTSIEVTRDAVPELELRDVGLDLGGKTILDGIHLRLPAGAEVAVVGPSGAGKSSLGRLLLGIHAPTRGAVFFGGIQVDVRQELRAGAGYVDGQAELPELPLAELLLPGAEGPGRSAALKKALALAGLEKLARSGDDLAKVHPFLPPALAQGIRLVRGLGAEPPRLLVLDEPYRGLTRAESRDLHRRLQEHTPRSTRIHITHDLQAASEADRVIVLEAGRIVEDGTPAELLAAGGAFAHAFRLASQDPLASWRSIEGVST